MCLYVAWFNLWDEVILFNIHTLQQINSTVEWPGEEGNGVGMRVHVRTHLVQNTTQVFLFFFQFFYSHVNKKLLTITDIEALLQCMWVVKD